MFYMQTKRFLNLERVTSSKCFFCKLHDETIMHDCLLKEYGINWNLYYKIIIFFRQVRQEEYHLRILGLRYEWTPYLKLLTNHFQNFQIVHLQCKNNRLLEYRSSTDLILICLYIYVYIKGIKDTRKKKLCDNDTKRRKKTH